MAGLHSADAQGRYYCEGVKKMRWRKIYNRENGRMEFPKSWNDQDSFQGLGRCGRMGGVCIRDGISNLQTSQQKLLIGNKVTRHAILLSEPRLYALFFSRNRKALLKSIRSQGFCIELI
jgi:hypothetical protein